MVIYTDDGLMITIAVTDIHGGQVKFGIKAPDHVHIDRKEIFLRKQSDKTNAET